MFDHNSAEIKELNKMFDMALNIEWLRNKRLTPLLKWPGGKTNDINHLKKDFQHLLPSDFERYFEPFLGGGAMWLSIENKECFVNDICEELMLLYDMIASNNEIFYNFLQKINKNWQLIDKMGSDKKVLLLYKNSSQVGETEINTEDIEAYLSVYRGELLENALIAGDSRYFNIIKKSLISKIKRTKNNEKKSKNKDVKLSDKDIVGNFTTGLKAGFYTYLRDLYNKGMSKPKQAACFYFLRDYCFSSMFRYNDKGEFNVPYGGMSYNAKSPIFRQKYWQNENLLQHLEKTHFFSLDFEDFLDCHHPTEKDFIFLDPPYDSEFSDYAKNVFGKEEQERLADYLINRCKAKFMAIMKNTEFIHGLYSGKPGIQCTFFDKNYSVSFKNRNEKGVQHIIVTNY